MNYLFHDVCSAAEAMPGLELHYRQLQSGPVRAEIGYQQLGDLVVVQASVDRRTGGTGSVLAGYTLFVLITRGSDPHTYDGSPMVPGQGFVIASGPTSRQTLQPGFTGINFLVPERMLETRRRIHKPRGSDGGQRIHISEPNRKKLLALLSEGENAPATQSCNVGDAVVSCLCESLNLSRVSDLPPGLKKKVRLASAICERLEECRDMTFGDICFELSVSERTARRVFKEAFCMGPGQYRLAVRLNQVQRELLACAPERGAVSRIATSQGFWHMGRFGTQYYRLFGETPRQTLGRSPMNRVVFPLFESFSRVNRDLQPGTDLAKNG